MAAWIRLSTACILMFATAFSADWATWLGPNRDGKSLETGLLKSWPEGGPKVVWKAGGLGEGYSRIFHHPVRLGGMSKPGGMS